jgi:undecaprenyl-diphosphatase
MDIARVSILALVQGLTEFFPVSSSGHLVVLQHLFGISEPQLLLDIVLHVGTLGAVILFLRKEILKTLQLDFRDFKTPYNPLYVLVALIPTGIIGLYIEKKADVLFSSPKVVAMMLIITGILLLIPKFLRFSNTPYMTFLKAFLIGVVQGIAVIPGISRSGSTIVVGLLLGLRGEEAGRFSFLISVPAIFGALLLEVRKGVALEFGLSVYVVGLALAFLSGLLALNLLIWLMKKGATTGNLYWFSPYCWALGLCLLVFVR